MFDLGVGMDPEISGFENIIIRGLFLGQTRKQMLAKVDEIADFTELGDYLSMPLRTYSTGMRVRLAMGVVTSIDPEILLLDEGIGAVDAEFMKKARTRLQSLVAQLRNPGVRQPFQRVPGPAVQDRDVGRPRHHQDDRRHRGGGRAPTRVEDAARHVREVLAENARVDGERRADDVSGVRGRRHPPPRSTNSPVSLEAVSTPDPPARPPHRRRQRRRSARCATLVGGAAAADDLSRVTPKPRRRRRFRARHAARPGARRGLGVAGRR